MPKATKPVHDYRPLWKEPKAKTHYTKGKGNIVDYYLVSLYCTLHGETIVRKLPLRID